MTPYQNQSTAAFGEIHFAKEWQSELHRLTRIQYSRCRFRLTFGMLLMGVITIYAKVNADQLVESPLYYDADRQTYTLMPQTKCLAAVLKGKIHLLRGKPVYRTGETAVTEPLANLTIYAINVKDSVQYVAVTDEAGKYWLRLPQGEYRIHLNLEPGWWSKDIMQPVNITANREKHFNIMVDSGIR